ncbi:MAG: DUF6898 family protein [Alphaproteobacteria bacterium]
MSAPPKKPNLGKRPASPPVEGEVYIEFHSVGNVVKVSAVDAATGTEVSIMGPANTARAILERNALRKLAYVLKRKE